MKETGQMNVRFCFFDWLRIDKRLMKSVKSHSIYAISID